jgi:hypothetical protein
MEERNDGGCEERAAKDFAKFSASSELLETVVEPTNT